MTGAAPYNPPIMTSRELARCIDHTLLKPEATRGQVSKLCDEALEHEREISAATPLPVSADLENANGDAQEVVDDTVSLASRTGLAACSIEDNGAERCLYPEGLAIERVRAAV